MKSSDTYFNENFKILDESFVFKLGFLFEKVYSVNKITNEVNPIFEFYGNPTSGLIGGKNDWFLIGGDVLILKTIQDNTVQPIGNIKDIHSFRLLNDYSALILTDPWKSDSAIYKVAILVNSKQRKIELEKIRDFKDYYNKPYTETVNW